jgi:CheY-like chemotaxis protein
MALVMDLHSKTGDIPLFIQTLKEDLETQHIPVLAFAEVNNEDLHEKARLAGAKLIAGEEAVLDQLPHLMEHLLEID